MIPITACLIVKNEKKNLKRCLTALKKLPISVLVCDTGSTDGSREIATELADYVIDFTWCNDFAAARNYAIEHCPTDWILFVDADEFLTSSNFQVLQDMMQRYPKAVGQITLHNTCLSGLNDEVNTMTDMLERVFNRKYYHYEGIIHEQIVPRNPALYSKNENGTDALLVFDTGLSFLHEGYIGTPEERKKKAERNIFLLTKMLDASPNDPYLYYQIGEAYMFAGLYEDAYRTYAKAMEIDIDPTLLYVKIMVTSYGYSMMYTGNAEGAADLINIEEYFAGYADFHCMLGAAYMQLCQNQNAAEQFEKALECTEFTTVGSNSFLAAHNLGCIYEQALYDYDKAIHYYELSIEACDRSDTKNRLTALKKRMNEYRKKADISLCIICKNEEKNLASCLEPFKDLPTEIVIVDTGSTDRTKEIASRYTDKLFDFTWVNDFSAARNFSISCAKNNWILVMDCDEFAERVPFYEMMALKETYPEYIGMITIVSKDSKGRLVTDTVDRFFDRRLYEYTHPIHEQLVRKDGKQSTAYPLPLTAEHVDYINEDLLMQKVEQNRAILGEGEQTPYTLFHAGHSLFLKSEYENALELFASSMSLGFEPSIEFSLMMIVDIGYCHIQLGSNEEGIDIFLKYYNDFKMWSDYLYVLASLYYRSGDISHAMLYYMQACLAGKTLNNDTKDVLPNFYLGEICEKLGDKGNALGYYKKCGDYEPALRRIEAL